VTDEGELIAGRYRLVSSVGRGAMGVVWRARDERLDREVAVKQLVLDAAADESATEQASLRVMREARVAARLRHPHAITIHDVVEHGGRPYLVMEFLPSRSLPALLAEHGTLTPEYVADIGSQVASALAAAHAEGIVHRDVTPGNVLISLDGPVKIADFGIARAIGEGTVTGGGLIAGTPAFLAPEVAGGADAGFPSDVFSLGSTLYTALEGDPPFGTDENPIALLQRVARGELNPPKHSGPLTEVLLSMLRRDPAERPTMAQAHQALAAVVGGQPVRLPPPPPDSPTLLLPGKRPRKRYLVGGAVAVCLVAVGVLIGALVNRDKATGSVVADPPPGTPTRVSVTPTTTTPTTTASAGCTADYAVTNAWPGGFQAEVIVRSTGAALNRWSVRWELPTGQSVTNLWNGTLSQQGSTVTVTNVDYNATVPAGGKADFGFTGGRSGAETALPAVSCVSP